MWRQHQRKAKGCPELKGECGASAGADPVVETLRCRGVAEEPGWGHRVLVADVHGVESVHDVPETRVRRAEKRAELRKWELGEGLQKGLVTPLMLTGAEGKAKVQVEQREEGT